MYTGLRLLLLVAVWLTLQLVTPLRGLIAVAIALVVSGVIGFFLLDRPRNEASASLSRVFGRINARIEASNRAEDSAASAGEYEAYAEQYPVGEGEQSGELQHDDESSLSGSLGDDEGSAHGQGKGE